MNEGSHLRQMRPDEWMEVYGALWALSTGRADWHKTTFIPRASRIVGGGAGAGCCCVLKRRRILCVCLWRFNCGAPLDAACLMMQPLGLLLLPSVTQSVIWSRSQPRQLVGSAQLSPAQLGWPPSQAAFSKLVSCSHFWPRNR